MTEHAPLGESDRPLQSIPDDGVHRRPDDWNVLAARGIAASLRPKVLPPCGVPLELLRTQPWRWGR